MILFISLTIEVTKEKEIDMKPVRIAIFLVPHIWCDAHYLFACLFTLFYPKSRKKVI